MEMFLSWLVVLLHVLVIAFAIVFVLIRKSIYQNLIIGLFGLSLICAWLKDYLEGYSLNFDVSVGAGIFLIIAAFFNANTSQKPK